MTALSKFAPVAAFAAALALPLASPALADDEADPIVVSSKVAMQEWQAETTRDLNRALAFAPMARKTRPNESLVQVTFSLGADGRADDIKVRGGDGNIVARQTAIYAVRQLDGLADVPVRDAASQRFLANIYFANDKKTLIALKQQAQESRARLAANGDGEDYILLGG